MMLAPPKKNILSKQDGASENYFSRKMEFPPSGRGAIKAVLADRAKLVTMPVQEFVGGLGNK